MAEKELLQQQQSSQAAAHAADQNAEGREGGGPNTEATPVQMPGAAAGSEAGPDGASRMDDIDEDMPAGPDSLEGAPPRQAMPGPATGLERVAAPNEAPPPSGQAAPEGSTSHETSQIGAGSGLQAPGSTNSLAQSLSSVPLASLRGHDHDGEPLPHSKEAENGPGQQGLSAPSPNSEPTLAEAARTDHSTRSRDSAAQIAAPSDQAPHPAQAPATSGPAHRHVAAGNVKPCRHRGCKDCGMTLTPEQLEAQQKQLDAQQKQLMEPWEPDMGEEERRQKMDSMVAVYFTQEVHSLCLTPEWQALEASCRDLDLDVKLEERERLLELWLQNPCWQPNRVLETVQQAMEEKDLEGSDAEYGDAHSLALDNLEDSEGLEQYVSELQGQSWEGLERGSLSSKLRQDQEDGKGAAQGEAPATPARRVRMTQRERLKVPSSPPPSRPSCLCGSSVEGKPSLT